MARRRITDAAIGEDLRRLAQAHGRLSWKLVIRHGRYAPRTYETRASTLAELRRLAGLPDPPADPALPPALVALARWPEARLVELWRAVRWPDGPVCPRCEQRDEVRPIPSQRIGRARAIAVYACDGCDYHFSDVTASWLHRLQQPLRPIAVACTAHRLGIPRPRLRALLRHPASTVWPERARESRLAQAYVDRLLTMLQGGDHAQNVAAL